MSNLMKREFSYLVCHGDKYGEEKDEADEREVLAQLLLLVRHQSPQQHA